MHGHFTWLPENERPCTHTAAPHAPHGPVLLPLFLCVTALHFLEIYPQSVLQKLVFLKKLSFKNVKHNEKWKSQKRRLFTATPLGFPHVSGSPRRLHALEITPTVHLAGNPRWQGRRDLQINKAGPSPWRQRGIRADICHPIHQSGPQRRSPFKVEDKEKSSFGKIVKKALYFYHVGGVVAEGHTRREFGWIWWRPPEGGRDWALRLWWTDDSFISSNQYRGEAQSLRRLKPEMSSRDYKIHRCLFKIGHLETRAK